MFSFHRPKVYRSSTGCCICKAKSSSSRFTDSKRYEEDFLECFKLSTPRQGEICNACVLLVKRWKKLPAGSDRNWQHVVDARAGPGMKSMTKFKSKNKKIDVAEKLKKKKRFEREFSPVLSDKSDDVDMGDVDFMSEEVPSGGSSRTASPGGSDYEDAVEKNRRHKGQVKRRENNIPLISDFIDLDYWKEEQICCGTIFKGLNNEIMLDHSFLKPCNGRRNRFLCISQHSDNVVKTNDTNEIAANVNSTASKVVAIGGSSNNTNITNAIEPDSTVSKLYSDSSSDSGYDESSNQGTIVSLDNNNLHGHHHHLHHHQQHLHHHLHHYNNKTEQVSIGEIKSQIPKINN